MLEGALHQSGLMDVRRCPVCVYVDEIQCTKHQLTSHMAMASNTRTMSYDTSSTSPSDTVCDQIKSKIRVNVNSERFGAISHAHG